MLGRIYFIFMKCWNYFQLQTTGSSFWSTSSCLSPSSLWPAAKVSAIQILKYFQRKTLFIIAGVLGIFIFLGLFTLAEGFMLGTITARFNIEEVKFINIHLSRLDEENLNLFLFR